MLRTEYNASRRESLERLVEDCYKTKIIDGRKGDAAGGNKTKIQKIVRLERQEYPYKTFEEVIEEKLGGF